MDRIEELKKVKEMIKEYYTDGDCGLYNTKNILGDPMTTIFNGKYFTLDICFYYSYFEVFGTNEEEFKELIEFYYNLNK